MPRCHNIFGHAVYIYIIHALFDTIHVCCIIFCLHAFLLLIHWSLQWRLLAVRENANTKHTCSEYQPRTPVSAGRRKIGDMESPTTTASASKVQRGTDGSPRIMAEIEADFAASNLSSTQEDTLHCIACLAARRRLRRRRRLRGWRSA
jgi:hypothetical protein